MSVQNYDWPAWKRVYTGVSQMGKTTLFWKHFTKEKARIKFLYDHKAMEFSRRYLKNLPAFTLEELIERTEKAIASRRGEIVAFSPMKLFPGNREAGFEFFCEFVFKVCEEFKGRKLFGCDELQAVCDENSKPEPLLIICDEGRTYQIDCFFIVAAMNAVHNRVRGQITEAFLFRHGDKNATKWAVEKGVSEEKLLTLKNHEFEHFVINAG